MIKNKAHFQRVLCLISVVVPMFLTTACVTERSTELGPGNGIGVGANDGTTQRADDNTRFDIRMQLAFAYFQGGSLPVALEEVNKALEIKPNSAEALSLKGLIYEQIGDTTNSLAMLRRAIQFGGNNAIYFHNYGEVLCRNQQYSEGVSNLRRAADSAASISDKVRSLAAMGVCYGRAGDTQNAESAFSEALALEPRNRFVLYYLTEYFLNRNDAVGAKYYFDQLAAQGEMNAQVLWQGIKITRMQGDAYTMGQYGRTLCANYPGSKECAAFRRGDFSL